MNPLKDNSTLSELVLAALSVSCFVSQSSFSVQPGCGVELSDVGQRFLIGLFQKYDKVGDYLCIGYQNLV